MTLEGQGQVGQRAQRDEGGAGVGGGQIAVASLAQEPGDGRRIVHADVGIDDQ